MAELCWVGLPTWSTSMIKSSCAFAGFATGAFIGFLLQLWMITIGDEGMAVPTVGEALLAGLALGFVSALLISLLTVLHARLRFWTLFPPVLLVAMLTGMISALLARFITPALTVALLAPLIGYLIGLIFCYLCGRRDLASTGGRP